MYIKRLEIEGYKGIGKKFEVHFKKGLNVIVGENASCKTVVIDTLRKLLQEDEYIRTPIGESDFYKPFNENPKAMEKFVFRALFDGLTDNEQVMFLPWSEDDGSISLTMQVGNKADNKGRYKPIRWGGVSQKSMFEPELFNAIDCIYLPPLRDAEQKLSEGKYSRLARLLKNLDRNSGNSGERSELVKQVNSFNKDLAGNESLEIYKANELIKGKLKDSLGPIFGQDTSIQFGALSFNRIAESVRLLFFPGTDHGNNTECFRSLEENSLGYNNLIYLATVLAELSDMPNDREVLRVLLIEEPEAHLHPQLQIKLLKYLEKEAAKKSVQIVVTTHSPIIASSVSIKNIIQFAKKDDAITAVSVNSRGIKEQSLQFLDRWLDATKSNLLFAKGIIFVEGISEALLIPELAKRVLTEKTAEGEDKYQGLPKTLEDAGVSVINMGGIYFKHFMPLFCNINNETDSNYIPIRCSGITDKDPSTNKETRETTNPAIKLCEKINKSSGCRLYVGKLKTFEYDLAFEGNNIKLMAQVLSDNWPTDGSAKKGLKDIAERNWETNKIESEKEKAALVILKEISDTANMGKGQFAQILAMYLADNKNDFVVPKYVEDAIIWACGGNCETAK